jgi:2-polyprenyl-6-methoxyphenol hydroxylase-like FAD-dependent oxidoreductase
MFIARSAVHLAVLQQVPKEAVEWGKKVVSVTETEQGVEVQFEDGHKETADLVVGADGVRSRVRQSILGKTYDAHYE